MDKNSEKFDDKEIEKLNVRCVIGALALLEATEDELVKYFSTSSGEPQNVVEKEIKRVLDHSVINGWIVRNGNKYALPHRDDDEYQIDGDEDSELEIIRLLSIEATVSEMIFNLN